MKYNGEFDVDSAFISGGTIRWHNTGNGEFIIATGRGKKYFVKRNAHVRYPSKGEPKAVYDKYKAGADAIQRKQAKLRSLMKGIDWKSDHIAVEEDNFWDSEKMFTTLTPYISDSLPSEFDFAVLGKDEFIKLAALCAKALVKLHACGVIHGDIKGKNIVVTHKGGVYTPYIIDFDSSYPADEIPCWKNIGGSEGYRSPEILIYEASEEDALASAITPATDIFSLGIVFHKWWSGSFPDIDLDRGSVGTAVFLDKAVTLNSKFDVHIGKNCGATLISLINWMFAKEPADRPTAKQVADVLEDKLEVPEEYQKGDDIKPFEAELWDVHKLIAQLSSISELKKQGVKSFKRINEGRGSLGLKYRVVAKGGAEKIMTIAELCAAGYAKYKGAEVDEPWDEHMIEFEPAEEIAKKGYAEIRKVKLAYKKSYLITTASGREIDKGRDWLISEGLAHQKLVEVKADTPWPEHGKEYDSVNMSLMGVKSIARMEVGGEHRYKIIYNEIVGGKNRTNERVPVNNVKLMGFIK